ncbi:MAG: tRNA (N6-threonylcarbamoyladenosine(37)-N6)-methyltransferase TrmO [Ruminococcaceae bacterium]|nr:tRNA (N6-threonylcarbamoyladenosine(37)-N6)-methyltransferase TrmO [Oscillospiraceae bacterium]
MKLCTIAKIENDFSEKFGIPRQSGLAKELKSKIVFEPEFAREEAIRGLEEFSHIWLIWGFSESKGWSPTVRPPRLGGNKRMGVFATRSPFRPNPLGLSAVKLEKVELGVLTVSGADLMNGTPIYDIKPYLPFADSYPDAWGGFAETVKDNQLKVLFEEEGNLSEKQKRVLTEILEQDPRPSYQNDPHRTYAFSFADLTIKFSVCDGILTVKSVT